MGWCHGQGGDEGEVMEIEGDSDPMKLVEEDIIRAALEGAMPG
jgi:hypothetical protein